MDPVNGRTGPFGPFKSFCYSTGDRMKNSDYGRYPRTKKRNSNKSPDEIIKELKKTASPYSDYRERSLRIHGLICAKCGREFDHTNRQLLTVHHKDGNHMNNPPDGSNWENLCIYCHDDEHSRELLGKYLMNESPSPQRGEEKGKGGSHS